MFKKKYQAVVDEMKPGDAIKQQTLDKMMKKQTNVLYMNKLLVSFVCVCLVVITMPILRSFKDTNQTAPESIMQDNEMLKEDHLPDESIHDTLEKDIINHFLTLSNGIQVQALGLAEEVEYEEFRSYEQTNYLDELSLSEEYIEGLNQFTQRLNAAVFTEDHSNQVYSPVSLYLALSSASVLASDTTQQQLLDYLGIQNMDHLLENTNHYIQKLQRNDYEGKIEITNSLWMDEEDLNTDLQEYDLLADQMYFSTFVLDMQSEEAENMIRQWLLDNTDQKIGEQYSLNPTDIMELINCINYETYWVDPFREDLNTIEAFYGIEETYKTTYMNEEYLAVHYLESDNIKVASKPSSANKDVVFILPEEGLSLTECVKQVNDLIEKYYKNEGQYIIDLSLPKFSFNHKIDLKESLMKVDGEFIFDELANFDKLHPDLYFTSLSQETMISIDETKISATSATMMGSGMGGFEDPIRVEMNLNRPFITCIVDRETQTILFTALIHQPERVE